MLINAQSLEICKYSSHLKYRLLFVFKNGLMSSFSRLIDDLLLEFLTITY